MRKILLVVLIIGYGLVGSAPDARAQTGVAPTALHVGDAIRITVWGNEALSGEFELGDDGMVIHPLYRTLKVAGMPLEQVEAEVRVILQRFETNPAFVVVPLFRVAIGGLVETPNIYTLPPYTTVALAVTRAGGPRPEADLSRVRLLRDGSVILVDLTHPESGSADLRIRSGDQIILDRRQSVWSNYVQPALTAVGSLASIVYVLLRVVE